MPLTKVQKQKITEDLKEKIGRQKIMIFVSITGLKVKDLFNLRKKLKNADSNLTVAKKTLMKIALGKKGIKLDLSKMEGEIAMVFGFQEEISPARIIYQFSRENKKLEILGGFFENRFRGAEEIITLAQLPSKEELLTRLIGTVSSPISNFLNVLQGNIKGLVYVLTKVKT